jgi:hypothetical protein
LLTIPAAPLAHAGLYPTPTNSRGTLEAGLKYLPHPRPWNWQPTTLPEKLRSFYFGTDRQLRANSNQIEKGRTDRRRFRFPGAALHSERGRLRTAAWLQSGETGTTTVTFD